MKIKIILPYPLPILGLTEMARRVNIVILWKP